MDIKLAALADNADHTKEGKLVLFGVFDSIRLPEIPGKYPRMSLALQVHFHPGEGSKHTVTVRLVDTDGNELIQPINTEVAIGENQWDEVSGGTLAGVVHLAMIPFEVEGEHRVDVFIDGRHVRAISFQVHALRRESQT